MKIDKKYKVPGLVALFSALVVFASFSDVSPVRQLSQSLNSASERYTISTINLKNGGQVTPITINGFKTTTFFDEFSPLMDHIEVASPFTATNFREDAQTAGTLLLNKPITISPGGEASIKLQVPLYRMPKEYDEFDITNILYSTSLANNLLASANINVSIPGIGTHEELKENIITLDESSPSKKLVNANTTDNTVSVLNIKGSYDEDIALNQLVLQLSDTEFNTPNDVNKITAWISDNSSAVGEAVFVGDHATMTLNNLIIPKAESIKLTIKADIAAIGNSQPAKAGHTIKIDWDGDDPSSYGTGLSSNKKLSFLGQDTNSEGVIIFKAVPTLNKIDLSESERTLITGSDRTLYKFSVSAPSTGGIGLYKFVFETATSGGSTSTSFKVNNFKVYGYSDSSFSNVAYESNGLLNSFDLINTDDSSNSNNRVEIYFNPVEGSGSVGEAIQVPAGTTRYFKLVGDVTGVTSTTTLSVQLEGDSYNNFYASSKNGFLGTAHAIDVSHKQQVVHNNLSEYANNFIWSSNSNVISEPNIEDWFNGYLVPGLPGSNMGAETLTP